MSDELVNKDKVTILDGDPVSDFWLKRAVNRYPGYTFEAKVYVVAQVMFSRPFAQHGLALGIGCSPRHVAIVDHEQASRA